MLSHRTAPCHPGRPDPSPHTSTYPTMPTNTEIAFILDRSGSMGRMRDAAIRGFNEFLAAQKATTDDSGQTIPAIFSLILFNDEYLPVHNREDIQQAQPLDRQTYQPQGFTALLDAIGRTIDTIAARIEAMPTAERPAKVIIAILTDGAENASQHHTRAGVRARITRLTKQHHWEFLFLGAGSDAVLHAEGLGIRAHQAAEWSADADDLQASQQAFSMKIAVSRRAGAKCRLDADEQTTLQESMGESLRKSRRPRG